MIITIPNDIKSEFEGYDYRMSSEDEYFNNAYLYTI